MERISRKVIEQGLRICKFTEREAMLTLGVLKTTLPKEEIVTKQEEVMGWGCR